MYTSAKKTTVSSDQINKIAVSAKDYLVSQLNSTQAPKERHDWSDLLVQIKLYTLREVSYLTASQLAVVIDQVVAQLSQLGVELNPTKTAVTLLNKETYVQS